MHQKTIMGHGGGLPTGTPTKPKVGATARKSSATGGSTSFSTSFSKGMTGANGPVAPSPTLKMNNQKSPSKKGEIDLDSVSSDEDDAQLEDPDNLGYSKQYGNSGISKQINPQKREKLFENPLANIK